MQSAYVLLLLNSIIEKSKNTLYQAQNEVSNVVSHIGKELVTDARDNMESGSSVALDGS